MKTVSLISIGNELLSGHTVNKNTSYLGEKILSCGLTVASVHTVSDNISEIVKALNRAAEDADFIICTGGLGPTGDDLTRQGIAAFGGVQLCCDTQSLNDICDYFASINKEMPELNKIQAYIPAGAQAIKNNNGTAAGIRFETSGKLIFALPGVPYEMKIMFERSVMPELKNKAAAQAVILKKLKCFGSGESRVAQILGEMMNRERNPLVNTTVHYGVITIHILASADSNDKAMALVRADEEKISALLGNDIFGKDDENLEEIAGKLLKKNKQTIAIAESCTGGLLAKMLTDIPGSSDYFKAGWVTYSNEAKINELGVSPDIIKQFGAVSEQTAGALASGARIKAESDFGIGITGIAGPGGASKEKPTGLVFIGLSWHNDCIVQQFVFRGERSTIRTRAAMNALNMLRLKLMV
ncbi:MAG: competence/damage-inducible protein A [Phycisphaerae bacterium]